VSRLPTGERVKTVIWITHRLTTARRADKIAMIEHGVRVIFFFFLSPKPSCHDPVFPSHPEFLHTSGILLDYLLLTFFFHCTDDH